MTFDTPPQTLVPTAWAAASKSMIIAKHMHTSFRQHTHMHNLCIGLLLVPHINARTHLTNDLCISFVVEGENCVKQWCGCWLFVDIVDIVLVLPQASIHTFPTFLPIVIAAILFNNLHAIPSSLVFFDLRACGVVGEEMIIRCLFIWKAESILHISFYILSRIRKRWARIDIHRLEALHMHHCLVSLLLTYIPLTSISSLPSVVFSLLCSFLPCPIALSSIV